MREPIPYEGKKKPPRKGAERRRAARTMFFVGLVSMLIGGPGLVSNVAALLAAMAGREKHFNLLFASYEAIFVTLGILQSISAMRIRGGSLYWHNRALLLCVIQGGVLLTIVPLVLIFATGLEIQPRLGIAFMVAIYVFCLFNATLDVKESRREILSPPEDAEAQ